MIEGTTQELQDQSFNGIPQGAGTCSRTFAFRSDHTNDVARGRSTAYVIVADALAQWQTQMRMTRYGRALPHANGMHDPRSVNWQNSPEGGRCTVRYTPSRSEAL
jgi:hypothetical protein